MKKIIFFTLTSLLVASQSVFAQDIVIQKNSISSDVVKDESFSINGISSREDIGGVEVSEGGYSHFSLYYILFENYTEINVNVLYLVNNEYTGSIVLKAGEKKQSKTAYYLPKDVKIIVRSLKGAQNSTSQSNNNNVSNNVNNVSQLKTVAGYLEYSEEFKDKSITLRDANELLVKLNATNYMGHNNWRFPIDSEVKLFENWHLIFSRISPDIDAYGHLIPVRDKK